MIAVKARHPQIRLSVDFVDRPVDLTRENHDVATRIARARDEGHDALRIGTVRHHLFARRDYLSERPDIADICDLDGHRLLNVGPARRAQWEFLSPAGKPRWFEFTPHLNSNSGLFLLSAVRAGLGIARLPEFIVGGMDALDDIERVLPEIPIPEWGIYLVHAEHRRLNRRMRLFAEEMTAACLPCHRT